MPEVKGGPRFGTKAVVDERAIARSVIEPMPRPNERSGPMPSLDSSIFWLMGGNFANDIVPWGRQQKLRDIQLRNFILRENIFAAALGIICSRNAGFSWKLDGPQRIVNIYQDIFENANMGDGWHDLIVKTSIDLYTQDNGAFWEIVRSGPTESDPVVAINHLDAARCYHTGNKWAPVIYLDRFGLFHLLRWWECVTLSEMPTPAEGLFGLQYCSLSRLLRSLQTMENEAILDWERTGGMNTRSIHLVKGITSQQLQDAMNDAKSRALSQGQTRFATPVVVGTIDPTSDVGHDTIDMASMPEGHDKEVAFAQYINLIAMAFETDYQEFAPLPGQKLGTGAQSEILHLKSRGKGPGTFMTLITHAINFRVLPKNLKFFFDEQDMEAEKTTAEVKGIRAQTRAARIASGEITPEVARQIAADDGDLSEEYIQLMHEQDVTPDITIDGDSSVESQTPQGKVKPGTPGPTAAPGKGAPTTGSVPGQGAQTGRPDRLPQPGRLAPLKAPTPMGTKSIEEDFEEYREAVKDRFDTLLAELDEARQPRAVRRVIHRDKKGLISEIEEVPVEVS